MNIKVHFSLSHKLKVLDYGREHKNVSKTCRYFGISRESYYQWKRDYVSKGEAALINRKPCPENPKARVPQEVEDLIVYLRSNYYLGQLRISWYLARYHGIKVSAAGVYCVLKRNGMNRLPNHEHARSMRSFTRYEKQVPGHRIQMDVKFLYFKDILTGKEVRRFQYTAIDDATRARALYIYEKHTQKNAIDFVNKVRVKFPFRIHTIQTDNGHEFQAMFHWHCEDLGIRHVYIKKASPHLNGKVERSHLTDHNEFYQLVDYVDDIDIQAKLQEWESFYNLYRPNMALNGKTPYEVLKEKMAIYT
jgi:transposase InsO family protein